MLTLTASDLNLPQQKPLRGVFGKYSFQHLTPHLLSQNLQEASEDICISKTNSQSDTYDHVSVRNYLQTVHLVLPEAEMEGGE